MKLENQVTSLELSKRLKELGVKQGSAFYWYFSIDDNKWKITDNELLKDERWEWCSSFTVAELGKMLPRSIEMKSSDIGFRGVWLSIGKTIDNDWYVMYSDPHPANKYRTFAENAETTADSMAKMLIYLLENNLIK